MTLKLPIPTPSLMRPRRPPFNVADVAVLAGVGLLLTAFAILSEGVVAPIGPGPVPPVTTDPTSLPYYAGRSLLRMFVALGVSSVFAVGYGYAAAKSRRAGRVLVPLLDVLQSVPILGFLSITIAAFMSLFPGSMLGLESASVFAIFTSMAWNMAFSVYHSLLTVPRDLDEAARMYHLGRWQRLRRVELPASAVGLVWNAMMSMGGAWFFLVASEAITVNNASYTLPGVGSYIGAAIEGQDWRALGWAVATMLAMIVAVNVLFWRPLVAWVERFKIEESAPGEVAESAVLDLLRRSRLVAQLREGTRRALAMAASRLPRRRRPAADWELGASRPARPPGRLARLLAGDALFNAVLAIAAVAGCWAFVAHLAGQVTPGEVGTILVHGAFTFIRVVVVVAASAVVWTPIGAWIGMNPRASRIAQPIVQIGASFPANFLFPFVTVLLLRTGIPIGLGAIPLMALGSQWYILFNAIAGGMAIPNDMREAAAVLGLSRRQRWRSLILPAIFPFWVTGSIAAAGGAWNASIVAETVSWGSDTLRAPGLGSDIAAFTAAGDFPLTLLGIAVMVVFVVGLNRLFWSRLYTLAETRYRLA